MPPRRAVEDPDPETVEDAADDAALAAQDTARQQAAERGVTLTDDQLDRIGQRAAEETHRLFERAGAFRQPEPSPPPPPPEAQPDHSAPNVAASIEEPPRQGKRSWAARICDS